MYAPYWAVGALVKAAGLPAEAFREGGNKADKRTRSGRSHGLVLKSKLRIYFKREWPAWCIDRVVHSADGELFSE